MNPVEVATKINETVEDGLLRAAEHFNKESLIDAKIHVDFSLKGRTSGRICSAPERNEAFMKLNTQIFSKGTVEDIFNTVLHEVAHFVTAVIYGPGHNHDRYWKHVCRVVGARSERCGNYKLEHAHGSVTYVCDCQEHQVSKILHNKMQKGQQRHCRRCRGNLTLKK